MADVVTFDPTNRLIIEINTGSPAVNEIDAVEVYSEWKDWLIADPTRLGWPQAFTPVGGDPRTETQNLGITRFLENGWRIRPAEYSHKLVVTGNLFTREAGQSIFKPTIGAYNVHTETVVSNIIDTMTVGGVDQATVQAALTAQGYTTARGPKLDELDAAVSSRATSGQGLTSTQATMLTELFLLMGLDPTKPLVVTNTTRKVPADGTAIDQTIGDAAGVVTVTRQ